METYTINKEQIKQLKDTLERKHSANFIRDEIKTNILPELFEKPFEVGKYYEYNNEDEDIKFVFKLKETEKQIDITYLWGYGLDFTDGNTIFEENCCWIDDGEGIDYLKEITQEEFMNYIKNYAIEELGFKKGVTINIGNIMTNLGERGEPISGVVKGEPFLIGTCSSNEKRLEVDITPNITTPIFKDGKFAEIVEESVINNEAWEPTSKLGYKYITVFNEETITKQEKVLCQKWKNINTGNEEWREIETFKYDF